MKPDSAAQQAPPLHEQLSRARRRKILAAIGIGTFMAPLDSSVVNIALPSISTYFHASLATVEWVVMAYLLVISSLLLTFGRLGDLYGHKRIYITGFVIFTVGSFLCGLSPTIINLIVFRAMQAIGAGMLMAMGPAIITDITPPQERGKALGIIAVAVSVALAAGPVVGGILTDTLGWPSIFYINLPIGILASFLAYRVIPDLQGREAQPFDIKGAVTIFFALLFILLPLSYTEKVGWGNPYVLGGLTVGVILLGFFIRLENRINFPMMDLTLFKNRLFSMSNLSALLSYIALFTIFLLMPFYLQQLRGLSPSQAGLLMIPAPLTTMFIAPLAGTLSDRTDTRYIASLGMAIMTVGMVILSTLRADSGIAVIIVGMIVVGIGSGMFQTPNNSAIMGAVPANRRGIASGLLAAMRNLGMILGVAVAGTVFTNRMGYLSNTLAEQGLAGLELKTQAFTGALHLTYLVAAAITAAAVFTSLVRGPGNTK